MNDLNYQSVRWGGRRVLNSSVCAPLSRSEPVSPCFLIPSYYFLTHSITQNQSPPVRSPVTAPLFHAPQALIAEFGRVAFQMRPFGEAGIGALRFERTYLDAMNRDQTVAYANCTNLQEPQS